MSNLPTDAKARKDAPMYRGLLKYFPKALAYVAEVSRICNEQHNPGQPMYWAKEKSTDHGDCIVRHQCDAGTLDTDGVRHSGKIAWRALAQLETELEAAEAEQSTPGSIVPIFLDPSKCPHKEIYVTFGGVQICGDCLGYVP